MIYEQTIIHDHHIDFEIKVLLCAIRWGSLQGLVNDWCFDEGKYTCIT